MTHYNIWLWTWFLNINKYCFKVSLTFPDIISACLLEWSFYKLKWMKNIFTITQEKLLIWSFSLEQELCANMAYSHQISWLF